jgi:hypothetical protein
MGVVGASSPQKPPLCDDDTFFLTPRGTVNSPAKFASKFALGGIFALQK